jgi:hypothetical protein
VSLIIEPAADPREAGFVAVSDVLLAGAELSLAGREVNEAVHRLAGADGVK